MGPGTIQETGEQTEKKIKPYPYFPIKYSPIETLRLVIFRVVDLESVI